MRLSYRAFSLLAALGLAAMVLVGSATSASAHATLESTTPGQGAELAASPPTVSLRFSEAVGIGPRAVEVLDAAGHRVDDGAPRHPADSADAVEVGLHPSLPSGSYSVTWLVVSADSHPIQGSFSFGVQVPAGTATAATGGDESAATADTALRALAYVGAVLLVGCAFFLLVLWPAGLALRRSRRLVVAGWAASAVAAAGLFAVQGPYGSGVGLGSALDPGLLADTLGSRYGKLMLLRLIVLVVAAPALLRIARLRRPDAPVYLAWLGVLFLLTFSFSEHAGQGTLVPLAVPADAVHLGAACVWIGGLAVLATCLRAPRRGSRRAGRGSLSEETATVLPRWSRTAMVAVALIVVTGTFQAWRGIGTLGALTGTTYGVLVLAKVAGLLVLLVLGDQGRRWIRRRAVAGTEVRTPVAVGAFEQSAATAAGGHGPELAGTGSEHAATGPQVRRLRTGVLAELGVAAVVLGLTTALVNTAPGTQAYAPPYSATLIARSADGGSLTVLLDVDSTRVGPTTVHLYTYTSAGQVQPFAAADARMTASGPDVGPVRFTFTDAGPGHGTASDVVVPEPGQWSMTVQVRTDGATDYAATTSYEVH